MWSVQRSRDLWASHAIRGRMIGWIVIALSQCAFGVNTIFAQSSTLSLKLCNSGVREVWYAIAFGIAWSADYNLSGWHQVPPMTCLPSPVPSPHDWDEPLYVGVLQKRGGMMGFEDGRDRYVQKDGSGPSIQTFCISAERFHRNASLLEHQRCPKGWAALPFTLQFVGTRSATVGWSVNISDDGAIDFPFPAYMEGVLPPPDFVPPRDGRPGTITATLLNGSRYVRWVDPARGWWFSSQGDLAWADLQLHGHTMTPLFRPPPQRPPTDSRVVAAVARMNALYSNGRAVAYRRFPSRSPVFLSFDQTSFQIDDHGVMMVHWLERVGSATNPEYIRKRARVVPANIDFERVRIDSGSTSWGYETPSVYFYARGALPLALHSVAADDGSDITWLAPGPLLIPIPIAGDSAVLREALRALAILYAAPGELTKS